MAQHDGVIDNAAGATFRADINSAIAALISNNSGASAPSTTYAFMLWADTSSGILKIRNAANNAWVEIGLMANANLGALLLAGGTMTGDLTMSGAQIITAEGADVTAAATTNIWATDGNTRHVTGNTTITSFGTAPQAGARMKLIFDGTPQLTQGTNLNLNAGGSNITIEAGDWAEVYADTTTQFDVVVHRKSGSAVAGGTAATTTSSGIVELITTAELQTGTDTTRAVTADAMLNAIGFSSRYNSGNQTITAGGALTLAHSLGREPDIIQAWLKCQTAEAGYSIGDKLAAGVSSEQGISRGLSIVCDSTNVNVRFGSDAAPFVILNKTTGTITTATNGNWRLVIDAWA